MNDMLADVALNFTLKRIVFVNSANHAYSEIMLDEHLALFGANNAGKTASLAATKLMLYPETDFTYCDKKFQFKGKAGAYSKEDSYEFYFPSDSSFLAMEIENDLGSSCVVLYRAGNYRYYRVFLPLPYEAVRPLFWNSDTHNFADDISINKLLAFNKQHNGIHVNDDKRLVELMYHNFARDDSRYCIVPLSDNNKNAVNAFRNIYQMAFDAGTGESDSLADAIATLVEMKRSRPQEKMSADLVSLEEKYHQLVKKGKELQVLSNNKERYKHIKNQFESLNKQSTQLGKCYAILSHQLTQQKNSYSSQYEQASKAFIEAQREHQQLSSQYDDLQAQQNRLEGILTQLEATINVTNQQIMTAEQVLSEHQQTDADVLRGLLTGKLDQLIAEQKALSNAEQTSQMLAALIRQNNQNQEHLLKQQAKADNMHSLLLNQLPAHTADVLVSLNRDFATIAVTITDEQQRTIQAFADMFSTDSPQLIFAQAVLPNTPVSPYDASQQAEQLRLEIKGLKDKIAETEEQIKALNVTIADGSGESRRQRLAIIDTQVATLASHIEALKRYDVAQIDIGAHRDKLAEQTKAQQDVVDQRSAIEEQKQQAGQRLQMTRAQKVQLEERSSKFEFYETGLSRIAKATGKPYYSEADIRRLTTEYEAEHAGDGLTLSDEIMHELTRQADSLITERADIKVMIESFIKDVPNERIDAFTVIQDLAQLGEVVEAYNTSFTTLDYQQSMQSKQISEHNNIISNQLKEIADAHQLLTDSIATINKEINSHKISNLDQVRLKLHRHADFNHVYKLYQSYDVTQTKLMGPEFYQSLISYVDKHANKRTGLLKMRDIISKISFEYQKPDGTTTDKSQSGGTTSTITASIIAILLGRIFMPNSSFKMPIIIDEIGDLDDSNTKTIIDCIGQHGFSAFCATPTQRTSVCQSVKRWVHVDYNVLEHAPQVADCVLNIMPEAINYWGEQPDIDNELPMSSETVVNKTLSKDTDAKDTGVNETSKMTAGNKDDGDKLSNDGLMRQANVD